MGVAWAHLDLFILETASAILTRRSLSPLAENSDELVGLIECLEGVDTSLSCLPGYKIPAL